MAYNKEKGEYRLYDFIPCVGPAVYITRNRKKMPEEIPNLTPEKHYPFAIYHALVSPALLIGVVKGLEALLK